MSINTTTNHSGEVLRPVENVGITPESNNTISSSSSDFRTRVAAGAVLLAKSIEAFVPSTITLTAIYPAIKVGNFVGSKLERPVSPFLMSRGISGMLVSVAAGIGCLLLSDVVAQSTYTILKAGRVKLEKAVGPEAVKTGDVVLKRLPTFVKEFVFHGTIVLTTTTIIALAEKTHLKTIGMSLGEAVVILGGFVSMINGCLLYAKYQPEM